LWDAVAKCRETCPADSAVNGILLLSANDCRQLLEAAEQCLLEYSGKELERRIFLNTESDDDVEQLFGKLRRTRSSKGEGLQGD
jgi:hypothetical protein